MSSTIALPPKGGALRPAGVDQGPLPELVLDLPRPRTRWPVLAGLLSIGLFFGGFAAWSFLAPLSESAVAPGVIKAEGSRRAVQHLEGGIVREILARDGDTVKAGQVLMRLDDIQAGSTLESLRGARWSLLAQDARLAAELAGKPDIAFPADIMATDDARAQEAMTGQRILFTTRNANLTSQLQVLEARLVQHEATIASARAQITSQQRQIVLLRREENDVQGLLRQGLERMPRLLALQRQIASNEGALQDLMGQVERAQGQIAETQHELQRVRDQRLQEVSTEAREVRSKLLDADERLRAATDVATRREIVAPEDGTVLSSKFFNPGAVVRPGDMVLELVPSHDRLIAEVKVSPGDIDVVHTGLQAEVRLPAFKQRLVPYLHGHVTFVGGDVNADQQRGIEFYRAQILIDQEQLAALEGVQLRAGMPVEAHIQIGERSFFRYMMQPVIDSFHRAFHEQ
ncbi:HlyD family type I secretion periplasmic adaptor subunit [Roseomonas sp. OT10]|uniref:HlyD family type I secretion periplasmic adaptor subunit n=1 Tax=Roseomonas cutis TaxID=2897332 RepID=UPI001E5E1291|nr:HlyD family type I secretion periplasmic adaptor subunit [Roseomonas sp. OT10]UFN51094.1 HlyD family type I secretion periplasmic adaptor subunit [Roseomonas sp. OT10]